MRRMIIGVSALAIAALPTLALADGNGAVTGVAGVSASGPGPGPVVVARRPRQRFRAAAEP